MPALKVLFIGGSGIISAHVTRRSVEEGHDVTVLNRSVNRLRELPAEATVLTADARNPDSMKAALDGRTFDAVVSWVNFTPDQVRQDIALFAGKTSQYVFISSASAYQTPPASLPVTEDTPLNNPYWEYSRNKIACEAVLTDAWRESGFPVTIVRPSHTYDETMLPFDGGWTVVDRMRRGLPVVVPGDGTSLWTITHSRDFAVGLVGLLGQSAAVGEAFHITGSESPTWNRIYRDIATAAGVTEPNLVHVASTSIAAADPEWGAALLGDKSNSMVFDNTKVRSLVPSFNPVIPFAEGAAEIVRWHEANPARQAVSPHWNALMDRLADAYAPRPL